MTNDTTIAEQKTEQADAKTQQRKEDNQQLLRDQALHSAVQYHIRDVIRAGVEKVQLLEPEGKSKSGMSKNQFSNVVNAAINAQHVDEVAAFILYQIGRSKKEPLWRYNRFGEQVVDDLLRGVVKETAEEAQKYAICSIEKIKEATKLSESEKESLLEEAHLLLARQYLGYLGRLFYVADETNNWKTLNKWRPKANAKK